MKKLLALVLAVLMVVTVFAGCAAKEESSSAPESSSSSTADNSSSTADDGKDGPYKFGYSPMTMNNPFFVYIEECARAVVEGNGDEMITADPQYDIAKQISQIEDMVSSEIDVLLLNPYDTKGIRPALDACDKAGIPIVNFDADVYDTDMVESILVSNNFEAGRLVGEKMTKDFPDGAKIAILDSPTAKSTLDRVAGFMEAIKAAGGEEKYQVVYQQDGKGSTQDSLPLAENALQANPDLDVFFGGNDPSAMGCVAALEAANKIGEVKVYGVDGSPEGKTAIKEGKMHGTGAQSPKAIAEQSVEVAYKILAGETVEHDIKVDVFLIDETNVDEYGTDSWQ